MLRTLRRVRRVAYTVARGLGDVIAAGESVQRRSPAPYVKRRVRARTYATTARATRRLLRRVGL